MALPDYIRRRAIRMRVEDDLTIDEIAERLSLSRTTVYYWVKDIPLSEHRQQTFWKPAQVAAAAATKAKHQQLRDDAYQVGWESYDELILVPTFREFVTAYLCEGLKRARNTVALGNSDPTIVCLAVSWFRRLAPERPLVAAVQYHADQDVAELQHFWAATIGVEPSDIRLQRKSNSNQLTGRRWRSVHGVLTVTVNDTLFRSRLQAWMDRIRADWSLDCSTPSGV